MDISTITSFFMWCTVINGTLLLLWTTIFMLIPNLVYSTQNYFFPIDRETFGVIFYGFLGLFKIIFLVFNVVPYVALLIVG